jgi:carbamoyl-phosphate synthase large subunit
MGLGDTYAEALGKALLAAGSGLPGTHSAVLMSLADRDKAEAGPLVRRLAELGYELLATEGTAVWIRDRLGLHVDTVTKKLNEGHPNVLDAIVSGRVGAVVNTVTGDRRPLVDGFYIRRAATERRIPCFTSLDTLRGAIDGVALASLRTVRTVDEYRSGFRVPRSAFEANAEDLAAAADGRSVLVRLPPTGGGEAPTRNAERGTQNEP